MGQPQRKIESRYTWRDYQSWSDGQRWELIGGEAFAMSPAPNTRHQRISGELTFAFVGHFRGKKCQPFAAATDVKLSEQDVVQPDLLVVCDPNQIKPTHIEGAPTLVVEILSHASVAHDRIRKMELYARFGVKEAWIVTPHPPVVEIFVLDGTAYRRAAAYGKDDELVSPTFPDLRIPLEPVFDFPPEPGDAKPMVAEDPALYQKAGR
jgi:Uma2 family endonuclease